MIKIHGKASEGIVMQNKTWRWSKSCNEEIVVELCWQDARVAVVRNKLEIDRYKALSLYWEVLVCKIIYMDLTYNVHLFGTRH